MLLKIKTLGFQNYNRRYDKNIGHEIVDLNKIYKFTLDHFLIGRVDFGSIVKKRYQK